MTVPFSGNTAFQTIMLALRDGIVAAMQLQGVTLNRAVVQPGAVVWDDCDQCGLLAVGLQRQFLADVENFPSEFSTSMVQNLPVLAADIVIDAVRCAPTVDDNGTPPSARALEQSSADVSSDAFIVLCAVTQLLMTWRTTYLIDNFIIRQQLIVGPQGACVGSSLTVTVGLMS